MADWKSDKRFSSVFLWYPPAETRVPPSKLLASAIQAGKNDFENVLCDYLNVNHCLLGNSGRALLASLLKTLKRRDKLGRNEVLIPGYTCYSVPASVVKAGLKIRAYDMDPRTLGSDLESLKMEASDRTLAIICQHLFGLPSPVSPLEEIAKSVGAYLIEDAAQGLGGALNGTPLGKMGDFGLYSFGRGKPLPLGGGGALIGKHQSILGEIQIIQEEFGLKQFTETAATQILSSPLLYSIAESLPLGLGETVFDPSFRISSMPRLIRKLAENSIINLNRLNARRRDISEIYREILTGGHVGNSSDKVSPVYPRFPLMAGSRAIPRALIKLGVRRMYPEAIVNEPSIRPHLMHPQATTVGASEIARNLITLPTHSKISEHMARDIAQTVKATFPL